MSISSDQNAAGTVAGGSPDEAQLLKDFRETRKPGEVTKSYLGGVRETLKERHFAGASGSEIVRELTAAVDNVVRALFVYAAAEHDRRFNKLNQRLGVLARGGYGRGELNPYSDIDLLFLHDWKPGPYLEIVAEIMLHALWDAGLIVGHAVRNIRECVRMADSDLKEKTAILDSRFLAGDSALWADLEKALLSDVLNRNQAKFFKAKLEESRKRHAAYGDSVYLLEPNLKEGEGGLRDLHTALWVAKVKYKVRSLEELVHKAIVTQPEMDEVARARDFLWRVRNSLHFLSRRHFDQLTFEYQEELAPRLGFNAADGQSASSELMRAYYQQASTIKMFAEGLIARITEEPDTGRFFRLGFGRQIRPGVLIQRKLLALADPELFKRDPLNLVTVFADCQAHGVQLSGSTYQSVRDHLYLIDEQARSDPRYGAALMGILAGRDRVAETLEAMHRAGVLGALIPEFGNLYARVLHDLYHIYTVDRHSLVAVRELERLRTGEFKATVSLLTEVARAADALPLVFLALVLHDIGKGHGHHHHERGAALAQEVAQRLGLDSEQVDTVVFLVRNHLLMSEIAQKRDTEDDHLVKEFAREMGSIERLKELYLMTFADMRAVAPKVYNNWRDMLLSDLYMKALKLLEQGDREAVDPDRLLAVIKTELRSQLASADADRARLLEEFLERMPERYFLITPRQDIPYHFDLMRRLNGNALVCQHRHFPDREFSEFIVATRDQHGLFSKIAGVLTANNLNILSARITTRSDGVVLDTFRISHIAQAAAIAMDEERWERVERNLLAVLGGTQDIVALVARSRPAAVAARPYVSRVATEVTVDNRTSERFTVIDVFTQDRLGLLFSITHALSEMGLEIHLARISTNADQALDVFYVSDANGRKIDDARKVREIEATLLQRLDERPAPQAPQEHI
ncbi:MAG TPA: [protein-PII] uridylyltransferase [Candidatus Binataceae bacterium]|nr:[protein-PII] uridylyltransferase [Candidatus Binataceae bacterium]